MVMIYSEVLFVLYMLTWGQIVLFVKDLHFYEYLLITAFIQRGRHNMFNSVFCKKSNCIHCFRVICQQCVSLSFAVSFHTVHQLLLFYWLISNWEGLPGGWHPGRKGVAGYVSAGVGQTVCFYCCGEEICAPWNLWEERGINAAAVIVIQTS